MGLPGLGNVHLLTLSGQHRVQGTSNSPSSPYMMDPQGLGTDGAGAPAVSLIRRMERAPTHQWWDHRIADKMGGPVLGLSPWAPA